MAITHADLLEAFPRLSSLQLDAVEIEQRTIPDAENYVKARLALQYVITSLVTGAPLYRTIVIMLSLVELLNRTPGTVPEWLREKVTRAGEWLEALATGEMLLLDTTDTPIPRRTDRRPALVSTGRYVPVFGSVPSDDEQYDPTRADDEEAARGR
jgi:hypothetical protein